MTAVDSSAQLTVAGLFTSTPQTAGAFANGYPQRTLDEFLEINLGDYPELAGLSENEYANATQFAIWATLGQLAVEGTDFTSGRKTIPVQTEDAQCVRIYRALQIILNNAHTWDRIYKAGISIRQGLDTHGGIINIEDPTGISEVAKNGAYGIKIENIDGVECYTREFAAASGTSTWANDYFIDLWIENAPEGTFIADTSNHVLPTMKADGVVKYRLYTTIRYTDMNDNGSEYVNTFKLCMPVRATMDTGDVKINASTWAAQYNIYLASNPNKEQQSYIIADPAYTPIYTAGEIKWSKTVTPYGRLVINKTDGMGNPLAGAVFTLTGADGTVFDGTSGENGQIIWEYLKHDVQYSQRT